MQRVAEIIVDEGVPLDESWVAALRETASPSDIEEHSPKQLAKAVQSLRWADVCSPWLLQQAAEVATKKVGAMDNLQQLADTALQFANAGCDDQRLFEAMEGAAESCSRGAKQPQHVVKAAVRFAAAGLHSTKLSAALARFLRTSSARSRKQGGYGRNWSEASAQLMAQPTGAQLWSEPALCAVWSLARTLPPPPPLPSAALGRIEAPRFGNPLQGLAVDVGCGFGGYVLGMAVAEVPALGDVNWLGVDTLPQASVRANSIARRWGIESRTQFLLADALATMQWVESSYAGPLKLVCIQFPTPFQSSGDCDSDGTNGRKPETPPGSQEAIHGKVCPAPPLIPQGTAVWIQAVPMLSVDKALGWLCRPVQPPFPLPRALWSFAPIEGEIYGRRQSRGGHHPDPVRRGLGPTAVQR